MALIKQGLQGENYQGLGGFFVASLYSGNVVSGGAAAIVAPGAVVVGSDVLLVSGAGRLNTLIPHTALPGTSITFYDAAAVSSGGPFILSGHKVLAVLPPWPQGPGALSGGGPVPVVYNVPFTSGLAVGCKSGQNLCSVAYTVFTPT